MGRAYIVKWTDNKGSSHEKYYKDEAMSRRVYNRKKNEKVLKTIYCERAYYFVGDEYTGDDTDYTIDLFVRKTVMGIAVPQFEMMYENGERLI